jgi:hypothetical protein
MSATISAYKRYSIRLDSHSFCRGSYVICIYLPILVSNTISMSYDVRVFNSKMIGLTCEAVTANPSGAPEFTRGF